MKTDIEFFKKRIQVFKDSINPYCAELVVEIYKKYGRDLGLNDNIVTPNDIYKNKHYIIIKPFGGLKDGI